MGDSKRPREGLHRPSRGSSRSEHRVEEVQAAKPTEDLNERWGGGLLGADDFVAAIYQSLQDR